jgi:putative heme-binding domain-containing protein
VGFEVGPDLAGLTNRSPLFLLTAILNPNDAVDARYLQYRVSLRDGRVLSGLIAEETASGMVLKEANGKATSLLRRDVESLQNTGLSLMPEGLERDMTKQDMADVMAYLASRGRR